MTDQRGYELGYLISPLLPEDAALKVLESMRALIESNGGLIENTQSPKAIRLAYPIKKMGNAYFGAIQFMMSPVAIKEVTKNIAVTEHVLRHLVTEWNKQLATRPIMPPMPRKAKDAVSGSTVPAVVETTNKDASAPRVDEAAIDKKLEEILGEN